MVFFFFKQKTAYEMRISDWSSDVCSSDLLEIAGDEGAARADLHRAEIAAEEIARVAIGPAGRGGAAFGPFAALGESARVGPALERGAAQPERLERGRRLFGGDAEFIIFGAEHDPRLDRGGRTFGSRCGGERRVRSRGDRLRGSVRRWRRTR